MKFSKALIILPALVILLVVVITSTGDNKSSNAYSIEPDWIIPRGSIYDTNNEPLAVIRESYDIAIWPDLIDDPIEFSNMLADALDLDPNSILNSIYNEQEYAFAPVVVSYDISREKYDQAVELSNEYFGIVPQLEYIRTYPHDKLCSHTLGYIGIVSEEDIQNDFLFDYSYGEQIGRSGLEARFEDELRSGVDLHLTIDYRIQEIAERALAFHDGAVVVLDAKNGDILALASNPNYNPNWFIQPINNTMVRNCMIEPSRPMLHRAVMGTYPLGSAFKVVTAIAALESDIITPETRYNCPGYYRPLPNSRAFRCHRSSGHGTIDLYDAIKYSCNVYFYNVAEATGPDLICSAASKLGLGEITGVNLYGERAGVVPNREWRERNNYEWYVGNTLIFGIGQGPLLVTPLQTAYMYLAIINGGILYEPRIVKRIAYDDIYEEIDTRVKRDVTISDETLAIVRRALLGVTRSGGTAASVFGRAPYSVGGKTGTAEYVHVVDGVNVEGRHTWFIGFTPADSAEIVVVVFVDDGESGEMTSAPIAKDIMDDYYQLFD